MSEKGDGDGEGREGKGMAVLDKANSGATPSTNLELL
jgi:hypothetical protein